MTTSGIEPAALLLVVQCLKQLRHRVPHNFCKILFKNIFILTTSAIIPHFKLQVTPFFSVFVLTLSSHMTWIQLPVPEVILS
jgi:hypothetical protein